MAENLPTERENERRGRGRPSLRSEALKSEICVQLAQGIPLTDICRQPGYPAALTVLEWQRDDPDFAQAIVRARDAGGDKIAEDALRIADDKTEDPASRRVRVETRLRLLAKWHPKRYGDRIDVTSGGEKLEASDGLSLQQAAKLAAILAEAEKRKGSE